MKNTMQSRTRRPARSGRIRKTVLGAAAAAMAVSLSACGAGETSGDDATTAVRVGTIQALGSLPLVVADEQGFFEEHGLDVEIFPSTDTSKFAPGLGNQFDVVMSTSVDFVTAATRGIDITAFAALDRTTDENTSLPLITLDSSITEPSDLRGKAIGVPSLAGAGYLSLVQLLRDNGISENEVTFKTVTFPTAADQLRSGQVDVSLSTIPFYNALLDEGFSIAFNPTVEATGREQTLSGILTSSKAFLDAHPGLADEFVAAVDEAIEWIGANDAEARAEVEEFLGLTPEVVEGVTFSVWDTDITVDDLEPYVRIVRDAGGLPDAPDAATLLYGAGE